MPSARDRARGACRMRCAHPAGLRSNRAVLRGTRSAETRREARTTTSGPSANRSAGRPPTQSWTAASRQKRQRRCRVPSLPKWTTEGSRTPARVGPPSSRGSRSTCCCWPTCLAENDRARRAAPPFGAGGSVHSSNRTAMYLRLAAMLLPLGDVVGRHARRA
jgi:hypothetical protein